MYSGINAEYMGIIVAIIIAVLLHSKRQRGYRADPMTGPGPMGTPPMGPPSGFSAPATTPVEGMTGKFYY
eukprot:NODE_718_length_649_cov_288.385057_g709_i0.p3 GENE.NODE_718_length_649_cov_288.385057_g709_i0~~NODE_718_length_649_cov_288.385057_g709_i0.p3  ORF type:complete len:70 (+),score=32.42 NODE_718_length_649_cov_288.385057_g709_i0:2-211(+)